MRSSKSAEKLCCKKTVSLAEIFLGGVVAAGDETPAKPMCCHRAIPASPCKFGFCELFREVNRNSGTHMTIFYFHMLFG